MNSLARSLGVAAMALASAAALATTAVAQTDPALPHLELRGAATQLIVDGHPYLILGGEMSNTAASSPGYTAPVWPRLARMGPNELAARVGPVATKERRAAATLRG